MIYVYIGVIHKFQELNECLFITIKDLIIGYLNERIKVALDVYFLTWKLNDGGGKSTD